MKIDQAPHSYRADSSVPGFDDSGPRTVMDAHCGLCAKGARWISRNDRNREFRIIPLQSELGRALMHHYGMDPDDPLSWLYLDDGEAHSSLDALVRVGQRLGGVWRMLRILMILPKPVRDLAYGLAARNRYRFFGRTDLCNLPDRDVQERLLQ